MSQAANYTAEDRRKDILDAMLGEVAFDGWTQGALENAARFSGMDENDIANGALKVLFPKGVRDVLDYWAELEDADMMQAYAALEEPPAKIREKVTWLVRQRIEQLTQHRDAARRAASLLALPGYHALGMRLVWRTSGAIWRALGDQSTDGNWYSKRATLSGVYSATLLRWFADDGEDSDRPFEETWAFLDQRIDNVMQIEKAKGQLRKSPLSLEGAASFLGKLRYAGGKI